MNRLRLEQLAVEWRRQILLRELLYAIAISSFITAFAFQWTELLRWQLPWLAFFTTGVVRLVVIRPWKLNAARIGVHLDRSYPSLEESAALFLRSADSLTLLERLQMDRVNRAINDRNLLPDSAASSFGAPPRKFLYPAGGLGAAGLMLCGLAAAYFAKHPAAHIAPITPVSAERGKATFISKSAAVTPIMLNTHFMVTPPAYTGHPARRVEGFPVEAEEGSTVDFFVKLDRPVSNARLSAGSTVVTLDPMKDHELTGKFTIRDTTLFSLAGNLPDGTLWIPPELFSFKVIKDQPPSVLVEQPSEARTKLIPPNVGPVTVEALVGDDYAVVDAHLVITVAKGTGEAVKFREQIVPFDTCVAADNPATRRFTKLLDLIALGMEPGDELYFYVEARDNRQPTANHSRSETRFILISGPEEKKLSAGLGVAGINLIPQYFRSERQIIIDTEKLIADRPLLADAEFRARANDLGSDQALLRLRYGRFLGEDQEESPLTDHLETVLDPLQTPVPSSSPSPRAAASIAQRFRQEHLSQDREGAGDEAGPQSPPDGNPLNAAQIRHPFVDSHDQHDKNTFFDNQTKGTMQDALSAMWEAERLLRTARPQEALTPEHRALDILKEIQQSDRAYVQHVGFEASPLKVAERRLKGEATDVPRHTSFESGLSSPDPSAIYVRNLLTALSQGQAVSDEVLHHVEPALIAAATREPDDYLPGLQAVRRLRTGDLNLTRPQPVLVRALLRLLPRTLPLPERADEPSPALGAAYYQELQNKEPLP